MRSAPIFILAIVTIALTFDSFNSEWLRGNSFSQGKDFPEPAIVASQQCPESYEDWRSWQQLVVQGLRTLGYRDRLSEVHSKFQSCRQSFERLGSKKACFKNLYDFTATEYRAHRKGYSWGVDQSDKTYLAELESNGLGTLPKELSTQEFLELVDSDSGDYATTIRYIKDKLGSKVIAFPYHSQHIPSVDDSKTFGRLLIYIPGRHSDIFTQFSINDGKNPTRPQSISVINVDKEHRKVYFNDLIRVREQNKITLKHRLETNGRMENCYLCHKSPLIPIVPEAQHFLFEKYGEDLLKANQQMAQYGAFSNVGTKTESYGPGYGFLKKLSLEEIRLCSKQKQLDVDPEAFYELGRCQTCHDGKSRGALNYPTGLAGQLPIGGDLVTSMVYTQGLMPPIHENLSEAIKGALVTCLHEDYYGTAKNAKVGRFNQWLLQADCSF